MASHRYHNNAGLFNDSAFEVFNNPTFHRQSSMESKSTLFGSFKSKFSKKSSSNSCSSPSSPPTMNTNPFSTPPSSTPRTRRPRDVGFATDSNDPPPPVYTAKPTGNDRPLSEAPVPTNRTSNAGRSSNTIYSSGSSSTPAPVVETNGDDKYVFLSSFDTIFLIDDSGSMAGRSWRECSLILEQITPICTAHDADGIDLFFLNTPDSPHYHNITTASTVHEIFSTVKPSGGTPTGTVLMERILLPYFARYKADPAAVKPMNIIVITDGVPSDDLEESILYAAKRLDRLDAVPWQIGIQLFQTGEEQGAAAYLEKLDNNLHESEGGCRDIVDTVPFGSNSHRRGNGLTSEMILKVVLGAVVRRLDRKRNSEVNLPAGGR